MFLLSATACGSSENNQNTETKPEISSAEVSEIKSENSSAEVSETKPEIATEETPETNSENSAEETPETNSENSAEEIPETNSENSSAEISETNSENSSEEIPEINYENSEEIPEETTEAKKIYQSEEPATDPDFDIVEMTDFQQLLDSIDNDSQVDTDKMHYEIYVEKVMVNSNDLEADSDNIQTVVMCRVEDLVKNKERYKTIAAVKDFYDATIADKPNVEGRAYWKFEDNGYYAWSAESIIKSALDYMNLSEDDMEMYKRYIIKTTFPE